MHLRQCVSLLVALSMLVGLLGSARAQDEGDDADWDAEDTEQSAPVEELAGPPSFLPGGDVIYLSDRPWFLERNGWGPVERDQNNGEQPRGDGRPISLGGTTFAKGLGVHADSEVRYYLAGACTSFEAVVGVDDEKGSDASVVFQVYADGAMVFQSGLMTQGTPPQEIELGMNGVGELRLVVTDGGNGAAGDHASWGDAIVRCGPSEVAFTEPRRAPEAPAPGASGQAPAGPVSGGAATSCGEPPSLELIPVQNGVRFEARGFTPGTLVMAWTIGPIRDGERVQRPDRWYDTSFYANDACRISDAMVILPTTFGRYGIYLEGERVGGGPPLTMFQLTSLGPSVSSPGLGGTPGPATQAAPEPPTGIRARPVDRATIRIEWIDNSKTEHGFRIEVNAGQNGVFAVPSNTASYSVGGLRPDTEYCFTVKAFTGSVMSSGADVCSRTPR
jgi:hypothetical protein